MSHKHTHYLCHSPFPNLLCFTCGTDHPLDASAVALCPTLLDPLQSLPPRAGKDTPCTAQWARPVPHPLRRPRPLRSRDGGLLPITVSELVGSLALPRSARTHRARVIAFDAEAPSECTTVEHVRAYRQQHLGVCLRGVGGILPSQLFGLAAPRLARISLLARTQEETALPSPLLLPLGARRRHPIRPAPARPAQPPCRHAPAATAPWS